MSRRRTSPLRRRRTLLDGVLAVAFASALAAPTIDAFVRDEVARGPLPEQRRAAPLPEWPADLPALSLFPSKYEAHFGDTFGLRDRLLRLASLERYHLFGLSPSRFIRVGKDGWLYWVGDRSDEVFRGVAPLTAGQLAGWQAELETRSRALSKINCHYLYVIAPSKESIYPERMPDELRPVGPTRLDQFAQWMAARSSVDVLDLRPALRAAKTADSGKLDSLYTPYGTHWTGRGALVVQREIVQHLARLHPEARPLAPEQIEMVRLDAGSDSLAGRLYMQGLLTSPDVVAVPRDQFGYEVLEKHDEAPARAVTRARRPDVLPSTLLFHDSFGPFVWSLLASSCERLETCGMGYDASFVDAEHTRIVIEMFVERVLVTSTPEVVTPPEFGMAAFAALPHRLFDMAASPDALVPLHSMPVERVEVEGAPALNLTLLGVRQGLTFPDIQLPARGAVFVRLVIDAPEPGLLDVVWRKSNASGFRRRDRATVSLEAGRNERAVALPALGGSCVVMVRPQFYNVAITLRELTVRSSERP